MWLAATSVHFSLENLLIKKNLEELQLTSVYHLEWKDRECYARRERLFLLCCTTSPPPDTNTPNRDPSTSPLVPHAVKTLSEPQLPDVCKQISLICLLIKPIPFNVSNDRSCILKRMLIKKLIRVCYNFYFTRTSQKMQILYFYSSNTIVLCCQCHEQNRNN